MNPEEVKALAAEIRKMVVDQVAIQLTPLLKQIVELQLTITKMSNPVIQFPEEIKVKLPERSVKTYVNRDERTGRVIDIVSSEKDTE
jgi:hypothetical protein